MTAFILGFKGKWVITYTLACVDLMSDIYPMTFP